MITDAALEAAIREGTISRDQVKRLRILQDLRASKASGASGPKRGNALSPFDDVSISVGVTILLIGIGSIAGAIVDAALSCMAIAAAAWLMGEYVIRVRHMDVAGLVLTLFFAYAAWKVAAFSVLGDSSLMLGIDFLDRNNAPEVASAACLSLLTIALHYWRFRTPLALLVGFVHLGLVSYWLMRLAFPVAERWAGGFALCAGLVVFGIAILIDRSESRAAQGRERAYWLHLVMAPLVIHPVFRLIEQKDGAFDPGTAFLALAALAAVATAAVLTDRRALFVSGMVYAAYSFVAIARFWDMFAAIAMLVTTVCAVGIVVGLLWRPLRRAVLARLPSAIAARLPACR
jgi:hypothetical protein